MPLKNIKRKNMCCVQDCQFLDDCLYKFPRNASLKNQWKKVLKFNDVINEKTVVCSNHFTKHNFFGIKNLLKKSAVPDQNLPRKKLPQYKENKSETVMSQKPQEFEFKRKTRSRNYSEVKTDKNENTLKEKNINTQKLSSDQMFKENNECDRCSTPNSDFHGFDLSDRQICNNSSENVLENVLEDNMITNSQINIKNETIETEIEDTEFEEENEYFNESENFLAVHDEAVQTEEIPKEVEIKNSFLSFPLKYFYDNISTPGELDCWTGVKNLELFNNLVNRIKEREKQSKILLYQNEYTNYVPVEELITIVMVRVRTNLNFLRMSTLFYMGEEEIISRFQTMLPIIKTILCSDNYWPSKRLGKSFCLILEPFEFFVENIKEISKKDSSMVKAMIGFNENGTILWSSRIYGRSTSYAQICLREGVFEKIRRIDEVFPRSGTNLHDEFKNRGITCYIDEKSSKKNFEKLRNKIRKDIMSFEIFQKMIPNSMIRFLDDIFAITAFIINLK